MTKTSLQHSPCRGTFTRTTPPLKHTKSKRTARRGDTKSRSTSPLTLQAPVTLTFHSVVSPVGSLTVCTDAAGSVRWCGWGTDEEVCQSLDHFYGPQEVSEPISVNAHIHGAAAATAVARRAKSCKPVDRYMRDGLPRWVRCTAGANCAARPNAVCTLERFLASTTMHSEAGHWHETLSRVPVVFPPRTSSYTREVWQTLRTEVKVGETISYKQLAERVDAHTAGGRRCNADASAACALKKTWSDSSLGCASIDPDRSCGCAAGSLCDVGAAQRPRAPASRAVGRAMATNPVCILVPCHRVLASSQNLHGYGPGLYRKVWLLRHEQANVPQSKLIAVEQERRYYRAS